MVMKVVATESRRGFIYGTSPFAPVGIGETKALGFFLNPSLHKRNFRLYNNGLLVKWKVTVEFLSLEPRKNSLLLLLSILQDDIKFPIVTTNES